MITYIELPKMGDNALEIITSLKYKNNLPYNSSRQSKSWSQYHFIGSYFNSKREPNCSLANEAPIRETTQLLTCTITNKIDFDYFQSNAM